VFWNSRDLERKVAAFRDYYNAHRNGMVRPAPYNGIRVPEWKIHSDQSGTRRSMNEHSQRQSVATLGIDLAKRSFQIYGVDRRGGRVVSKKLNRAKPKSYVAKLSTCLVAMEACGSAHYWARLIQSYGHEVRLISPHFVKPYVKSNKNDAVDAEAICEAAQRPGMRFVAVKSVEQQDVQALHRMRQLAVERRTAQVNQIRGLLLEYGIAIPKGRAQVRGTLPDILEDAENGLTWRFREALAMLYGELVGLDASVAWYDERIEELSHTDERDQLLLTIPGIGPLTATALLAAIGDVRVFKTGRELAAWLGLVPRQHSTGGESTATGNQQTGRRVPAPCGLGRSGSRGGGRRARRSAYSWDAYPLELAVLGALPAPHGGLSASSPPTR
jgi:transposase